MQVNFLGFLSREKCSTADVGGRSADGGIRSGERRFDER